MGGGRLGEGYVEGRRGVECGGVVGAEDPVAVGWEVVSGGGGGVEWVEEGKKRGGGEGV